MRIVKKIYAVELDDQGTITDLMAIGDRVFSIKVLLEDFAEICRESGNLPEMGDGFVAVQHDDTTYALILSKIGSIEDLNDVYEEVNKLLAA